jgi:hypothetical protein
MPYSSSAGSSGIAHLASAYGVPMVASNIADFRELAEEEGLAIDFFECGKVRSLADTLLGILENPERQMDMALQNVAAALRMSMPEIIRQYLRTFDLQQQLDTLTALSRLRKLPRWFPFRPRMARRPASALISRSLSDSPAANQEGAHHTSGYRDSSVMLRGIFLDDQAKPPQ